MGDEWRDPIKAGFLFTLGCIGAVCAFTTAMACILWLILKVFS